MIKVKAKDRVNINFFLIMGLMVLGILLIRYIVVTHDYVSVDATVVQVGVDTSSHGNPHLSAGSSFKYVIYSYKVEGKTYTARQQIMFTSHYKSGMQKRIKCNPENPEKIYNALFVKACLFMMVFLALFMFGVSKARKSSYKSNQYD